jgi:hypothetical protein
MNVAAGVPSASATGVPPSAMVSALPCWCGATMRRAYPETSAHSIPANSPAMNRTTSVSVKLLDRAVARLVTT